jgi:cold shock CspA family protein
MKEVSMQGTVKDFDEGARTGSAVTDDRTEIEIEPASFPDDSILMLRLGQRVTFEVEEVDGRSVARGLTLVTFAGR